MLKLREIPSEMESLILEYNSEDTTDERRLELEAALEKLEVNVNIKADAIADLIFNFESEAEVLKAEVERINALKKYRENVAQRLKSYLSINLWQLGHLQLDTKYHRFFFRKSESIFIKEDARIPKEYCREVPAKLEPDKTLLKQAIKAGVEVKGAWIETKHSLQIK